MKKTAVVQVWDSGQEGKVPQGIGGVVVADGGGGTVLVANVVVWVSVRLVRIQSEIQEVNG